MTRIKNVLAGLAFLFAITAAFAFSSADTTTAYAYKVISTGQCFSGLPASQVPSQCSTVTSLQNCTITPQQGASIVFVDQQNGGTACDIQMFRPN